MEDAAASDCDRLKTRTSVDPKTTGSSGRQSYSTLTIKRAPLCSAGGQNSTHYTVERLRNNEAVHRKLRPGDEAKSSRCERSDPSAEVLRLTLSLKARPDELPSGRFHTPPSASIRFWLIIANVCIVITASHTLSFNPCVYFSLTPKGSSCISVLVSSDCCEIFNISVVLLMGH